MIINAPYTPSNLRGGGNYLSDHTPRSQGNYFPLMRRGGMPEGLGA